MKSIQLIAELVFFAAIAIDVMVGERWLKATYAVAAIVIVITILAGGALAL